MKIDIEEIQISFLGDGDEKEILVKFAIGPVSTKFDQPRGSMVFAYDEADGEIDSLVSRLQTLITHELAREDEEGVVKVR